jgi:hypothetical protein
MFSMQVRDVYSLRGYCYGMPLVYISGLVEVCPRDLVGQSVKEWLKMFFTMNILTMKGRKNSGVRDIASLTYFSEALIQYLQYAIHLLSYDRYTPHVILILIETYRTRRLPIHKLSMQCRKYIIPITVNNTEFETKSRNSHCGHYVPRCTLDSIVSMINAPKY